ncbi:MAG: phosphotransferase [Phycisphaerae bacterium]|nr:phosphotransferase [Phycisphaerae bacterium]
MDQKRKSLVVRALCDESLASDGEFHRFAHSASVGGPGLVDYLFSFVDDRPDIPGVFDRLRWGGQIVLIGPGRRRVTELCRQYQAQREFRIEQDCRPFAYRPSPTAPEQIFYYFIARKVRLVPADGENDRFICDLELVPEPAGSERYRVLKQVPPEEQVARRLAREFPQVDSTTREARARSFTRDFCPLFLEREIEILRLLQSRLSPPYRRRVPHVLDERRDHHGRVTGFTMNWLRNGVGEEPMPQLTFAAQALDLLRAIHDEAGIIHLDLRPDNVVVTESGVGFIDFGASVRQDEDLDRDPTLKRAMDKILSRSGVQRHLCQLCDQGLITSSVLRRGYGHVDKAMDLLYVMLQVNNPAYNPELAGLVEHRRHGADALALGELTGRVMRPANPAHPRFSSADEIYRAIRRYEATPTAGTTFPPTEAVN